MNILHINILLNLKKKTRQLITIFFNSFNTIANRLILQIEYLNRNVNEISFYSL